MPWVMAQGRESQELSGSPPVLPHTCSVQVAPNILSSMSGNGRTDPTEAGHPGRKRPEPQALEGKQTLALEVQRIHVAQQIEDLEWELSLLLQWQMIAREQKGANPATGH